MLSEGVMVVLALLMTGRYHAGFQARSVVWGCAGAFTMECVRPGNTKMEWGALG